MAVIHFPPLEVWGQQLANILPLTALLEFVDVETKLHIFQLSGLIPLWNWPLTPAGARMLLSDEDNTDACCLDRPSSAPVLHCMDCKFGNFYPSSAPTTTRFFLKGKSEYRRVKESPKDFEGAGVRKQILDLVVVRHGKRRQGKGTQDPQVRSPTPYLIVCVFGWLLWITILIINLLGGLYVAAAYIFLLPLTGFAIGLRYGGKPRLILDAEAPGAIDRLVVVTNSLNSSDWCAFIGPKDTVNGLLNRPLIRTDVPCKQKLATWMIRACAAGQWTLALAACACQSWDAFSITFWIALCALATTYLYPPEKATCDWLQTYCGVELDRIKVKFTSRRSMLAALMFLNPDKENTEWMDPILSKTHQERLDWQCTVLDSLSGKEITDEQKSQYWFKYVEEGIKTGIKVAAVLKTLKKPATGGC